MKDYKTTIAGLATGLAVALSPFAIPGAEFTWQNMVMAVGIALLGRLSKDS